MARKKGNDWGKQAEEIAAQYLQKQGLTVRERNWRPPGESGSRLELDIVAQQDTMMVFVEVKARSWTGGDPVEAVDEKKIRHMCRSADIYLRCQNFAFDYRFDIISVVGDESRYELEHIPDAFFPPLSGPGY